MLHPSIFDFIRLLKAKGKIVSLYTNGSLIHRNIQEISEAELDYCNISHYDDKFDDIRGSLSEFLKSKKRPITRLSKIITSSSIGDMRKILETAKQTGFDSVIFQNYYTETISDTNLV